MVHTFTNFATEVFCGFYDSPLYDCDMFDRDWNEVADGWHFDFTEDGYLPYCEEMAACWVQTMKDMLSTAHDNFVEIGEYKGTQSPREYNYSTDKLAFDCEFDEQKLKDYCFKARRNEFDKYLDKHWSSRDGFISFIPHTVKGFEYEYENGDDYDRETLLDVMLEWYFTYFLEFDAVLFWVLESQKEILSKYIGLYKDGDDKSHGFKWDNDNEIFIAIEE